MDKAKQILRDTFKFDGFKLQQELVIKRLVEDKRSALVLFPTGGGKSLCYQIPALCFEDGITLVITPLIALMHDQVEALRRKGYPAAHLDSTLTPDLVKVVKGDVRRGALKLLYVAPERLNNEGFMHMMQEVNIALLAVDESHCISEWGANFRPDYLKISRFAEENDVKRVLCLTATATPAVAQDICKAFHIDLEHGVFMTPVYRQNLALEVQSVQNDEEKMKKLIPLIKSGGGPAIIYVTLQRHADEVAQKLKAAGISAAAYHAGMKAEDRESVQTTFMASKAGIVVATIAFGMGIDKSNIRQIIHMYMPKSLEGYSQETGRAGRDGLPSTCTMFLCPEDISVHEGFARGDTCSKSSLELWLQEVALEKPSKDGTLSFNHYQQSKLYDIRANALGLLYAALELQFNLIRAVTPYYSVYEISINDSKAISASNTPAAKLIRKGWTGSGKWKRIDVVEATNNALVSREEVAKQIGTWELDGLVETKVSQVRHRYAVLPDFLELKKDLTRLATQMHEEMLAKEKSSIERIHQVVKFATGEECLSQALAAHFGTDDAVPGKRCRTCTWCKTGVRPSYKAPSAETPDASKIAAILAVIPDRNDPRLLARFAFGISSPRLTELKVSRHPLFGSLDTADFNYLVNVFEEECNKCGGVAAVPARSRSPVVKKTSTGAFKRKSIGNAPTSFKRRK